MLTEYFIWMTGKCIYKCPCDFNECWFLVLSGQDCWDDQHCGIRHPYVCVKNMLSFLGWHEGIWQRSNFYILTYFLSLNFVSQNKLFSLCFWNKLLSFESKLWVFALFDVTFIALFALALCVSVSQAVLSVPTSFQVTPLAKVLLLFRTHGKLLFWLGWFEYKVTTGKARICETLWDTVIFKVFVPKLYWCFKTNWNPCPLCHLLANLAIATSW